MQAEENWPSDFVDLVFVRTEFAIDIFRSCHQMPKHRLVK